MGSRRTIVISAEVTAPAALADADLSEALMGAVVDALRRHPTFDLVHMVAVSARTDSDDGRLDPPMVPTAWPRLRRVWHGLAGHPRESMRWGSIEQGAVCACGARFRRDDFAV